jgi:pimeloyl-ACP methyl ester carboxylesterase
MKKSSRISLAIGVGVSCIATVHFINKITFYLAALKDQKLAPDYKVYRWKFGDIAYTVQGNGSPLLLLHDLTSQSSKEEWCRIVSTLEKKHTVYTIDLLGCGHSDKPNFTYTAYMYIQLIHDFVINVITKKTDIIATGYSSCLGLITAYCHNELFNKLVLINPPAIEDVAIIPNKSDQLKRKIINIPILGTSIYNILMSQFVLRRTLCKRTFAYPAYIPKLFLEKYYRNAHLYGPDARYLFSSITAHYTTVSLFQAVSELNNSILIVQGYKEPHRLDVLNSYINMNTSIEATVINATKHLPQIENPEEFINALNTFL